MVVSPKSFLRASSLGTGRPHRRTELVKTWGSKATWCGTRWHGPLCLVRAQSCFHHDVCKLGGAIPSLPSVTVHLFGNQLAPKNTTSGGTSFQKYMRSEQILHAEEAEESSLATNTSMASRRWRCVVIDWAAPVLMVPPSSAVQVQHHPREQSYSQWGHNPQTSSLGLTLP